MKHKLGILTALILGLTIVGSTFAAPGNSKPQQNKTVAKTNYTAKNKTTRKHRKPHQVKTAKMMKNNTKATTTKK